MFRTTVVFVMCGLLGACVPMGSGGGGTAPASSDQAAGPRQPSLVGQAAAVAMVVAAQAYRAKVQGEMTSTQDSQKIAEKQAMITSLDTIQMRMVNFGQAMTLGEKLQIATSVSDIVRSKFPDKANLVSASSTLLQVVMTATNAANAAAQQEAAAAGRY